MATSLYSLASTTKVVIIDSRDTVGNEKSSLLLTYHLCHNPFAQVCPFNFPHLFSFMRFMASRVPPLSFWMQSEKGIGSITCFPSITQSLSCFNSLKIEAMAFLPCFLMPLVADIWVNTTFILSLYRSRSSSVLVLEEN